MENTVKIEIGFDKIQVALEKAADEMFKSSYNNPVTTLLKECIEKKNSEVKRIINSIITESISSPDFKAKMADVIIQKMIQGALKN